MDEEQIARFNAAQRDAFDRSHHLFLVALPDASGSGNRFFDMASTSTLTAVTVVFEQPPAT